MPENKGFEYFLVLVELACRRVDGKPLKNKEAGTVLRAFRRIYKRGRIIPPTHRLEVDNGTEFNNELVRNFFITSVNFEGVALHNNVYRSTLYRCLT